MRVVVRTADEGRRTVVALAHALRANPGGLLVTIVPYRPPKTTAQIAKIHAMIGELANAFGYEDQDELKQALKMRLWPRCVFQLAGKDVVYPKSTRDLTREEASVVIEKIHHLAAEHGHPLEDE